MANGDAQYVQKLRTCGQEVDIYRGKGSVPSMYKSYRYLIRVYKYICKGRGAVRSMNKFYRIFSECRRGKGAVRSV
jgi:hypothetical protein